jgi:hypothetical protein
MFPGNYNLASPIVLHLYPQEVEHARRDKRKDVLVNTHISVHRDRGNLKDSGGRSDKLQAE